MYFPSCPKGKQFLCNFHRKKQIAVFHINDSKNPFAAHKDRHEKLGEGYIGLDAFQRIINHPALKELPFYLETPHEEISGYEKEISILKNLRK